MLVIPLAATNAATPEITFKASLEFSLGSAHLKAKINKNGVMITQTAQYQAMLFLETLSKYFHIVSSKVCLEPIFSSKSQSTFVVGTDCKSSGGGKTSRSFTFPFSKAHRVSNKSWRLLSF